MALCVVVSCRNGSTSKPWTSRFALFRCLPVELSLWRLAIRHAVPDVHPVLVRALDGTVCGLCVAVFA